MRWARGSLEDDRWLTGKARAWADGCWRAWPKVRASTLMSASPLPSSRSGLTRNPSTLFLSLSSPCGLISRLTLLRLYTYTSFTQSHSHPQSVTLSFFRLPLLSTALRTFTLYPIFLSRSLLYSFSLTLTRSFSYRLNFHSRRTVRGNTVQCFTRETRSDLAPRNPVHRDGRTKVGYSTIPGRILTAVSREPRSTKHYGQQRTTVNDELPGRPRALGNLAAAPPPLTAGLFAEKARATRTSPRIPEVAARAPQHRAIALLHTYKRTSLHTCMVRRATS